MRLAAASELGGLKRPPKVSLVVWDVYPLQYIISTSELIERGVSVSSLELLSFPAIALISGLFVPQETLTKNSVFISKQVHIPHVLTTTVCIASSSGPFNQPGDLPHLWRLGMGRKERCLVAERMVFANPFPSLCSGCQEVVEKLCLPSASLQPVR